MTCINCNTRHTVLTGYFLERITADETDYVCSPSCLTEYAWKLKEGQTKLSKSKS